jgi:SAM-dependent methyltransferase
MVLALVLTSGCAAQGPDARAAAGEPTAPRLDVIWVASDLAVVTAMLEAANVGPRDVVYDLGCGDGRIVVAAAAKYGARGVGVDLDPQRVREARMNAILARVADRVTFEVQDLFATDLRPATVVTLYLAPEVNLRLRPKLLRELRPGSRVVSHQFDMGDWLPERTIDVPQFPLAKRVYLWRIPQGSVPPERRSQVPGSATPPRGR